MKTTKEVERELLQMFRDMADGAGCWSDLNWMDIDITITQAMSHDQRADLLAMMVYLDEHKGCTPGHVLAEALHDIYGLKAVYLADPVGNCFLPRSASYASLRA